MEKNREWKERETTGKGRGKRDGMKRGGEEKEKGRQRWKREGKNREKEGW